MWARVKICELPACGSVASAIASRFCAGRWRKRDGPASGISLLASARTLGYRDALRIRFMTYGSSDSSIDWSVCRTRSSDWIYRLRSCSDADAAALSGPTSSCSSAATLFLFLGAIYLILLGFFIFNMALTFAMFNQSIDPFGLSSALIFPFYQGVYLKCARFFPTPRKYSSRPPRAMDFRALPRVRRALFGEGRAMNITVSRPRSQSADPVESRRRAAGGWCASPT